MAFSANINMVAPVMRSLLVNGSRACLRPATIACYNTSATLNNRVAGVQSPMLTVSIGYPRNLSLNNQTRSYNTNPSDEQQPASIVEILDREIQDETAELQSQPVVNQFPGFHMETEGADVKLTKQVGNATVAIRFTVSSSLADWPVTNQSKGSNQEDLDAGTSLMSMPEFQVQIRKNNRTLEVSCFFEEYEVDDETGEPLTSEPVFNIDELVLYEGEPKETEFAVSAEYFQEDLQTALLDYLAEHGIDQEFTRNLVSFATGHEKKHYIELMKRIKSFVASA